MLKEKLKRRRTFISSNDQIYKIISKWSSLESTDYSSNFLSPSFNPIDNKRRQFKENWIDKINCSMPYSLNCLPVDALSIDIKGSLHKTVTSKQCFLPATTPQYCNSSNYAPIQFDLNRHRLMAPGLQQRRRMVAISSPLMTWTKNNNSILYDKKSTIDLPNDSKGLRCNYMDSKLAAIPEEGLHSFVTLNQQRFKRMVPINIDGFVIESNASPSTLTHKDIKTDTDEIIDYKFDHVNICDYYKKHFLGKEHYNMIFIDSLVGLAVLSLKQEADGLAYRAILRTSLGSKYAIFDSCQSSKIDPTALCVSIARQFDTRLSKFEVEPVSYLNCLQISEHIHSYDERIESRTFKFGILFQKRGQITEEQILHNSEHTKNFDTFLQTIADKINLRDFDHYKGGLDTSDNTESYYTTFKGKEIMFHVSTMLPLTPGDHQQLQRKRHVGNDIVIIVFQDSNDVTFSPEMLQSNFIHCIIVVQPLISKLSQNGKVLKYRVSVLRREDVPAFGPAIPYECINSVNLRNFMLTKLIHAEYACYRANKFFSLQTRTRHSLLQSLVSVLRPDIELNVEKTTKVATIQYQSKRDSNQFNLIGNVRRALNRKFSSVMTPSGRAKSLPSEFPIELKMINETQLTDITKSSKQIIAENDVSSRIRSTSDVNHSTKSMISSDFVNSLGVDSTKSNTGRISADSLNDEGLEVDEGYGKDSGSDSPNGMVTSLNSLVDGASSNSSHKKTQTLTRCFKISHEDEV